MYKLIFFRAISCEFYNTLGFIKNILYFREYYNFYLTIEF